MTINITFLPYPCFTPRVPGWSHGWVILIWLHPQYELSPWGLWSHHSSHVDAILCPVVPTIVWEWSSYSKQLVKQGRTWLINVRTVVHLKRISYQNLHQTYIYSQYLLNILTFYWMQKTCKTMGWKKKLYKIDKTFCLCSCSMSPIFQQEIYNGPHTRIVDAQDILL